MNNPKNIFEELYHAGCFFAQVLDEYFNLDEADNQMEFDMEMFSEFCENVQITYSAFYEHEDKKVLLGALQNFRFLVEMSTFSVLIDIEHEILGLFASKAVSAIEEIVFGSSKPNEIADPNDPVVWYDFDIDTPEDVYDRFKKCIQKYNSNFN